LNERVIAIELADLTHVDRVVGIAGGRRKFAAIRGALRGRLINVLITDRSTAERLVKTAAAQTRRGREATAAADALREARE
jgi:DNA-binding transcriptional regulator LsrR (DeoR family)